MAFERELHFLNEHKEVLISRWFSSLSSIYIDMDFAEQMEKANLYFEFITDFHIAAEHHPLIDLIPEWNVNFQNTISYPLILTSNDIWRDIFIDILLDYENPKEALQFLRILLKRQDLFFSEYCGDYLKIPLKLIKEKDVKIDKLHDDRLNLIGKMASSMAHEIRNPLTSIAGFLKLIRQNILNRSQTQLLKYIDVIDDEFDAINMHITGFLSFSKNRILEENYIEISILQLINSTVFLQQPRLISENIHCVFNDEDNCNSIVSVQKISIQQVISNIISNAIDALITVKYRREIKIFCNEDDEFTYIHIINNGSEISKEMRDALFEPFITDKENGTGLGLAICREIMTKNNGTIDFNSNNKETSFILSFSKQRVCFD